MSWQDDPVVSAAPAAAPAAGAAPWMNDPVVGATPAGAGAPRAPPQAAAAPAPSMLDKLGRQAGLTARYGIEGIASLPTMLASPINALMGQPPPAEALSRLLTRAGLPEPQTGLERVVGAGSRAVAGAGPIAGGASLIEAAPGVAKGVASALAARPGAQATGAALGAGTGEGLHELHAPPWAAIPAEIAASALPFAFGGKVPSGAPMPKDAAAQAAARETGFVLPPTQVNPSAINRIVEGWGGKVAVQQNASIKNQPLSNQLAREAIGLSKDAPLEARTFDMVREEAGQPYAQIKSVKEPVVYDKAFVNAIDGLTGAYSKAAQRFPDLFKNDKIRELQQALLTDPKAIVAEPLPGTGGPPIFGTLAKTAAEQPGPPLARTLESAAAGSPGQKSFGTAEAAARSTPVPTQTLPEMTTTEAVELVKTLRARATAHFKSWDNPDSLALAHAEKSAADAVDEVVARKLDALGKPDLAQAYREGRQRIARTYDVEAATNEYTGNVNARQLAKIAEKRPFTDQLADIAQFANIGQKAALVPEAFGGHPGINPLDIALAGVQAAQGHAGGAARGLGLLFGRPLAAKVATSDWYQNQFVNPQPLMTSGPNALPAAWLNLLAQRR